MSGEKQGLDDFIFRHGADAFHALVNAAIAEQAAQLPPIASVENKDRATRWLESQTESTVYWNRYWVDNPADARYVSKTDIEMHDEMLRYLEATYSHVEPKHASATLTSARSRIRIPSYSMVPYWRDGQAPEGFENLQECILCMGTLVNVQLRLDASASSGSQQFTFRLENELQLYNDLEITGDGNQVLLVTGTIRDFYEPRSIIKSGTSGVTLAGINTFRGPLVINEGRVATTNLASSVQNNGGTFAPGISIASTSIDGNFEQNSGTLEIELGGDIPGSEYDVVDVNGNVKLGGILELSLMGGFQPVAGQTFDVLDWIGTLTGSFVGFQLPSLTQGLSWNFAQLYQFGVVSVSESLPGDFNQDWVVDAADYVFWRKSGGSLNAYNTWRANFGQSLPFGRGLGAAGSAEPRSPSVPEPAALLLVMFAAASWCKVRGTRRACFPL